MSSRVRHPAKSFVLFVLVLAGGYVAWQNHHMFDMERAETLTPEQRMAIREDVVVQFQRNPDFLGFRAMAWRPNEGRYFIDIEVDDGCADPRELCEAIGEFIEERADVESTIRAVNSTGREVGRSVM